MPVATVDVEPADMPVYSNPALEAIHRQKINYYAKKKCNPGSRISPTGCLPEPKRRKLEQGFAAGGQLAQLNLGDSAEVDLMMSAIIDSALGPNLNNSSGSTPTSVEENVDFKMGGTLYQQGKANLENGKAAEPLEGELTRAEQKVQALIKSALVDWERAPYDERWIRKQCGGEGDDGNDSMGNGDSSNTNSPSRSGNMSRRPSDGAGHALGALTENRGPNKGAKRTIADEAKQESLGAELKHLPPERRLRLVHTRLNVFSSKNIARCVKIFATENDAYALKDKSLPNRDDVFHRLLQAVMKDRFEDYTSKAIADVCFSIAKFYVENKSVAWRARNKAAMGMGRVVIDAALGKLRYCVADMDAARRGAHVYCCSGSELQQCVWAAYRMERTGNPNLERLIGEVIDSQWRNFTDLEIVNFAHYMVKLKEFNEDMINQVVNRFRQDVRTCPAIDGLLAVAIEGQSVSYVSLMKQVMHYYDDKRIHGKLGGNGFGEVIMNLGTMMRQSGCDGNIWQDVEAFTRFALNKIGCAQTEKPMTKETLPKNSGKLMMGMGLLGVHYRPFVQAYMSAVEASERKLGHELSSRYFSEVAAACLALNCYSEEVVDTMISHAEGCWDALPPNTKCAFLWTCNGYYFNGNADMKDALEDDIETGSMNAFARKTPSLSKGLIRRLRNFICTKLPKLKEVQILDKNQLDEECQALLGYVAIAQDQVTRAGLEGRLSSDENADKEDVHGNIVSSAKLSKETNEIVTNFMSPPAEWKDMHRENLLEGLLRTVADECNEIVVWAQGVLESAGHSVERNVLVDELVTANLRVNGKVLIEVLNPKCSEDVLIDTSASVENDSTVGGGMVRACESASGNSNLRRVVLETVLGYKLYSINAADWETRKEKIQAELEALVLRAGSRSE